MAVAQETAKLYGLSYELLLTVYDKAIIQVENRPPKDDLQDKYDRALQHLLQSRVLGIGDVPDLGDSARYHAAILMTRMEQYEQALETLGEFAGEGNDNPRVIEALGIATLRMPMLPTETPPDRREMILMAGRASYMMATRNTAAAERAFDQLVSRYPETPNVHYAYGVFLLQEKGEKAIEEFKRELELQPQHPVSLMQLAYEYRKRGEPQAALPFAKQAVEIAPKAFPARKALGQALLETGDIEGAIRELELGIGDGRGGAHRDDLQAARAGPLHRGRWGVRLLELAAVLAGLGVLRPGLGD